MHSCAILPLLAGLAAAIPVSTTETPTNVNPTPDALPLDFLANVEIPTYSTSSKDVPYAAATAIAAVAAAQSETPLSVFPAVTDVAINAAGDGAGEATALPTPTAAKRDLAGVQRRAACDPQPTISSKYSIDVSSANAFRASTAISDAAKAAKCPDGYSNKFVNLGGANSAYAYMGYTVVDTGYDVNYCASQCDKKDGCLAFNIYFERDPTIEPGDGCTNPPAFASIKCSFWGSALDSRTATNTGQWRAGFEVAIAGSNAYTSKKIGGKLDGWSGPLDLGTAVMQAPLYDAANTWTYLGYKLFQDGPFDVKLCAAACDAQTQYNVAHPPSTGYTPLCAAFGTYQLTVTDRNTGKSSVVGQMCTMYTSAWDAKYATNTVAWNDAIMTKYTYSLSYFYSKSGTQPVSDADLAGLKQDGGDFCTSYINYLAPTTSTTTTVTPVATISSISSFTETTTVITQTVTTATGGFGKRDVKGSSTANSNSNVIVVSYITASSDLVPAPTFLTSNATMTAAANSTLSKRIVAGVATPTAVSGWDPLKISAACSRVATGTVTQTSTSTLASTTTVTTSTTTTTTISTGTITTVAAPTQTVLFSGRSTDYMYQQVELILPFPISGFGISNRKMVIDRTGWGGIYGSEDENLFLYMNGFYGDDPVIRQPSDQHLKATIYGSEGHRSIVFDWSLSSAKDSSDVYQFSLTVFEDRPGVLVGKYYQMYNLGRSGMSWNPGNVPWLGLYLSDFAGLGRQRFAWYSPASLSPGDMFTADANDASITPGTFVP